MAFCLCDCAYILPLFYSIVYNLTFLTLEKFYPKYLPYLKLLPSHTTLFCKETLLGNEEKQNRPETEPKPEQEPKSEPEIEISNTEIRIDREEIEHIMDKMGLFTSYVGESNDHMGKEDFSSVFEDSEPGFDEIREAFLVFDQNRDGFIDASGLQRMFITLGLRDCTDLDACRVMIDQYDRNRDGKVDLRDFSKLVEMSLQ